MVAVTPAPVQFAFFLLALYGYTWARSRRGVRRRIENGGFMAEALSQPFVILFIFLAWICLTSDWAYNFSAFMHLSGDDPFAAINGLAEHVERPPALCEVMREKICHAKACPVEGHCAQAVLEKCIEKYPDACDMMKMPLWLRWLVFLSPPSVIVAMVISVVHAWRHARYGRPWRRGDLDVMHEYAVEIILLPAVYGIFSLVAVVHIVTMLAGDTDTATWRAGKDCDADMKLNGVMNLPKRCWSEYIDRSERWYDLNFIVGDLYEARALYCFTWTTMEYIELQQRRRGLWSHSCPDCSAQCPSCGGQNNTVTNLLLTPLKEMTMLGVELFNITQVIRAISTVILEELRIGWYPTFESLSTSLSKLGDFDAFGSGFTICISSIAIWNLVTFEHHLTKVLQDFNPKTKFWSAKIIVSLAFIQQIVLSAIGSMLQLPDYFHYQESLVYACLMCLEMLPVALLQWVAWQPDKIERVGRLHHADTKPAEKIEFSIARGGQQMQVTVEEVLDRGQHFWRSASVTMLSSEPTGLPGLPPPEPRRGPSRAASEPMPEKAFGEQEGRCGPPAAA